MPLPLIHVPQDFVKQLDLKVSADYRTRIERRIDRDFQEAPNDNRSDLHQRVRIGVNWKASEKVTGFLQYQYAQTTFWSRAKNASDENSDLFQAYGQIKDKAGVLTIGRQRINLGSERLVGSLEWVNAGRSFDAVRFENKVWDVFGAVIAVQNVRPRNVRLAAASYKHVNGTTSLIAKHDSVTAGEVDIFTLAHAYKKQVNSVEVEAEAAIQFGDNAGKDHEAWAIHAQANFRAAPSTKVALELNSASGGSSATKSKTFDNLYPTNHKFYGLMDLHAWKNLDMLAATFTTSPTKTLDLKLRAATSRLRDAKDAWYGAAGSPNRYSTGIFQDPTGTSGTDIGREFDFEAIWRRNPKETLTAGIGIFVPGEFVKNVSGDNQSQIFGFVMYSVRP